MRPGLSIVFFSVAVLAGGCDSATVDAGAEAGVDAGRDAEAAGVDAGADAGPIDCDGNVDETCPESLPYATSRCAVGLTCTFDDPNGSWEYTCPEGRWEANGVCDPMLPGACPVPRFSERCSSPFTGMISGGTVQIGPVTSADFRPFMDEELVDFTVGAQGSAMIAYRIEVGGVGVPACVRAVTTLSSPIIERVSEPRTISLLCGSSLGILGVVQRATPCPEEPAVVTLTVDVSGVGTASVNLTVPAMAFCAGFG